LKERARILRGSQRKAKGKSSDSKSPLENPTARKFVRRQTGNVEESTGRRESPRNRNKNGRGFPPPGRGETTTQSKGRPAKEKKYHPYEGVAARGVRRGIKEEKTAGVFETLFLRRMKNWCSEGKGKKGKGLLTGCDARYG